MPTVRVGEWSGAEQRKYKRVPLGVPIECRAGAVIILGRAENLGLGGLLVRAEKNFPWDEEVSVSLTLPGSTGAIQLQARVAHVVPEAFMGLEFLELSPAIKGLIEEYVAAAEVPEKK